MLSSIATSFGVLAVGRHWLSTKIEQSIKHRYDVSMEEFKSANGARLEELKSQLARHNTSLELAQRTLSSFSAPFHQKKIDSIVAYWDFILKIGNRMPPAVLSADLFLPSEYAKAISDGILSEIDRDAGVRVMEDDPNTPIERIRPFIGEYLWGLLFAYRALLGRLCYLYYVGLKARELKPWFEDKHCLALVRSLLSDQQFAEFTALRAGKFNAVRTYVLERIAREAGNSSSGRQDSEEQLRAAHQLANAASGAVGANTNKTNHQ